MYVIKQGYLYLWVQTHDTWTSDKDLATRFTEAQADEKLKEYTNSIKEHA